MLLVLMIGISATLSLMYWWITRPEPPPLNIEEEITRKAIARINWRKRPSVKIKSGLWNPSDPEQGMLVTIPFDNTRGVRLLFSEGVVTVDASNRTDSRVELAAPDSIDDLAKVIERVWAGQYR